MQPVTKYRRDLPKGNGKAVVVDGARSPFVKSFGAFEDCDALELVSRVVDGLVRRTLLDPKELDEIACGVVLPQPKNPNVARDAVLNLGLPGHIHGYTLNRACASSLQTIADAAKTIAFGQPHFILAGGVEVLSDVPIVYSKSARKFLVKLSKAKTPAAKLALLAKFSPSAWLPKPPTISEPLTGLTMGEHSEIMAKLNGITRADQDALAVRSHTRAAKAQEAGILDQEVIPIWPSPKFLECVDKDNLIRKDSTLEAMAGLRPAFDRKYGTITAGNASPLTDGAAFSLIADEERARSLGLKAKARIKDFIFIGVNPYEQLLIGPALAIPLLAKRNGLAINDIGRFELHEAFSAQVLCCINSMDSNDFCETHLGSKAFGRIPDDCLNVNGGAIALGHPFGATGSRLVNSMANELIRSDKQFGMIAICAAGGMAGAMLLERV